MSSDDSTQPGRGPGSAPAPRRPERYELRERLGQGGMGVVWEAYDRALGRTVALKYLHDELLGAELQERLADEARAMAKLSHPNVVAVYDVGDAGGRTYVVMELVRGRTVASWLTELRSWAEIAAVFRDAGRGLAAAHRAGIVHRDVKPSNILVGDDGRARVADFGLAATDSHGPGTPGYSGTPAYMAPERHAGAPADAASDQYALFASLHEALHGAPPGSAAVRRGESVPGWLEAAVARGLEVDPAARFASMDDAVAALSGPRRRRHRVALAAVALTLVLSAAGFAIGVRATPEAEPCTGGAAEIAAAWNPAIRDRVAAHLRDLGPFAIGETDRLLGDLARYAQQWSQVHHASCAAMRRGDLTAAMYERNASCLARGKISLATAAEVLARTARGDLATALVAARSLTSLADCEQATDPFTAPPAIAGQVAELRGDLERARVLAVAIDPSAVSTAQRLVAAAQHLGHRPTLGRAHLVHGLALLSTDTAAAVAPLERATRLALEVGDDLLAVEAFARQVYCLGRNATDALASGAKQALGAIAVMEPIALRLGPPGRFARALLFNNMGVERLAAADRAAARAWFLRAHEEANGRPRPDDAELANIAANLALVVDDARQGEALLEGSRAELERLLGPDHARTLGVQLRIAVTVEHPARAEAAIQRACVRYADLHADATAQISACMFELGWLALERGDQAAAQTAFRRVSATANAGPAATGYLAVLGTTDATALAATARELEATAERLARSDGWWLHKAGAEAQLAAATAWIRARRPDDARRCLVKAECIFKEVATAQPATMHHRRLASARRSLARIAGDPALAAALATAAIAWYRTAGGYGDAIAELEPLTAGSPTPGGGR